MSSQVYIEHEGKILVISLESPRFCFEADNLDQAKGKVESALRLYGKVVERFPDLKKPAPVLMSRDNPDGRKLEELAAQLAVELLAKNEVLLRSPPSALKDKITANNAVIIKYLEEIVSVQNETLRELNTLGPDPGPRGTPRV